MASKLDLRIVHFTGERIPDPQGIHPLPWQKYQEAADKILDVCRKHGAVGAMGACPIRDDIPDPFGIDDWNVENKHPTFYVVDDQYNDERYLYVEIMKSDAVTIKWFTDAAEVLNTLPGWGLCISNITNGYVILLPPVLLVTGPSFSKCEKIEDVIDALRQFLHV